jgi:branched-chain amino acid aminotransferase
LPLELGSETPDIFIAIMKTTDAMVLDEPKTHVPASDAVIEPAVESRPRRAAGVKEAKIYIDGKFYPEANAKISVFDHGLLYGDGIFEGIRFYNGRVFRLEEHLRRLWDSARSICLQIPMSMRDMTGAVLETIRQNHLRDGYIRLIVTRGVGNLGLNPEQCKHPSVIIIAATIALYHEDFYQKGLTIVTCATRRSNPASLNPAVKSLNYLNNVMARIEANLAGADEALMLNDAGNVAECTADNVFIVKHGQIFTPPITAGALRGITRGLVFEIAAELGIKISETDITRHDVFVADECFLTGTAAEIVPVVKADGRPIGNEKPGAITTRTIARFREMTRETGTPIFIPPLRD